MDKDKMEQDNIENLKITDFFKTDSGDGVLIRGSATPDILTELRQRHESRGAIPLSAQIEIAWMNEDDETVRDIILLQDSVRNIATLL